VSALRTHFRRAWLALLVAGAALATSAPPVTAQLSTPCEVKCGVVLGASAYAVGTAAMVAWGRHVGGVATGGRATAIWLSAFGLAAGSGIALGGDGARQERAVYASGVGLGAGALVGLAVGAASDGEGDALAMSLIGAGIGSLLGGVIGALSHEAETSDMSVPVLILRIPM
jgi:hypothetical protein